jgi:alpha-mannosidase
VLAGDVPALSVKVVPWSGPEGSAQPPPTPLGEQTPATSFENQHYRIEIDPASASIVSLYDKALQREWADPTANLGIGTVIYEEADRGVPHPAIREDRRHFRPLTPGPRFVRTTASGRGTAHLKRTPVGTTITMEAEAPYLPLVRTSVTLYDDLKCLDLSVLVDKRENFDMEGVYAAFPFAVDSPAFLMETANAVYRACDEQLPNTCRDWYSVQHAVGITGREAGVLWASRDAPLVQLGEIRTGRWDPKYVPVKGHLYAWLMNNLYFTNFKAAQSGRMAFDFRLGTIEGPLGTRAVREWGEAFALPLVALTTNSTVGEYRWLDVQPGNIQVQVLKSSPEEGYITLRLKETAGEPVTATLTWLSDGAVELLRTDLLEAGETQPVQGDGRTFSLPVEAHRLVTLRMVFVPETPVG